MDRLERARNVFDRIEQFEPELVARIVGYLLMKEKDHEQILQLAYPPDSVLLAFIQEAKAYLTETLHPSPSTSTSLPPYYSPRELFSLAAASSSSSTSSSYCIPCLEYPIGSPSYNRNHSSLALGRSTVKPCHYFYKGYCKHEDNCRFYHGKSFTLGVDPRLLRRDCSGELVNTEDQMLLPHSLWSLKEDIRQLLIFRRGKPIPITVLPGLYYEMYGKVLQGDGYLTEMQRQGHASYNLMKLLVRLTNDTLQLIIDKPHGQYSVALTEDELAAYMEQRYNKPRSDAGEIVTGSDQVYLTFPPESDFTEDKIASYFSRFGEVEDVRFPTQLKRMFGYVRFADAETVSRVLSNRSPHYVDGARILVKPYRARRNQEGHIPTLDNSTTRSYNYGSMERQTSLDPIPRRYAYQSAFNYSGWHGSRLLYQSQTQQQQEPFELQLHRDWRDDECPSLYDDFPTMRMIEQVLDDDDLEKEVNNVVQSGITGDGCANTERSGGDVVVDVHTGSPEVEGDSKKENLD